MHSDAILSIKTQDEEDNDCLVSVSSDGFLISKIDY